MTTARPSRRNISEHVRVLHDTLVHILSEEDRAYFIRTLNEYQKDRDVIHLVKSLKGVLDSPRKREVYPLLREIIPSGDRRYFEKSWQSEIRPRSTNSNQYNTEWSLTRSKSPSRQTETPKTMQRSQFHSSLPGNLDKYDSGIDLSNARNGTNVPRKSHKYPIRRIYMKRSQGTGYGFSMRGGSEHGIGLYVSSVDENSLAEYEGLLPGDHILSVNEVQFDGLAHNQGVKIIKNSKKLNMVVRSVGFIPNTFVAEATYKWIDPTGHRVSPPPSVDSNGRHMSIDGIHRSDLRLLGDDDERKVNIYVDDGDKLGLKIRGGAEYGLGIYIAGVDINSAADRAGLKCGDQIMDVNGVSFLNISHSDAVKALKSAKNMMFTMKDVGRLPFVKTTKDRTKWAKGNHQNHSKTMQSDVESMYNTTTSQVNNPIDKRNLNSNTSGNHRYEKQPEESKFRQGVVGSQVMYNGTEPFQKGLTEEQSRQVLNENEFSTMAYYLEEYSRGYITVEDLVLALFSLLNTPAKVSLLTDIRGSILPKDIDRFDDLVLKKEIDAIKTRNRTVPEDAQSLYSAYSSSLSSCSAQSTSSSTRNSYGDVNSRPITPPRIPEVFPTQLPSDDKTLTNDSYEEMQSIASPNEPQNYSFEMGIPLLSSSPRDSKQKTSKAEATTNLLTGDKTRIKTSSITKTKDEHTQQQSLKINDKLHEDTLHFQTVPTDVHKQNNPQANLTRNGHEETLHFQTISVDVHREPMKKEKKGFSLFGHSKTKGSYSPNKQNLDNSALKSGYVAVRKKANDGNKTMTNEQHASNVESKIMKDDYLSSNIAIKNTDLLKTKNDNITPKKLKDFDLRKEISTVEAKLPNPVDNKKEMSWNASENKKDSYNSKSTYQEMNSNVEKSFNEFDNGDLKSEKFSLRIGSEGSAFEPLKGSKPLQEAKIINPSKTLQNGDLQPSTAQERLDLNPSKTFQNSELNVSKTSQERVEFNPSETFQNRELKPSKTSQERVDLNPSKTVQEVEETSRKMNEYVEVASFVLYDTHEIDGTNDKQMLNNGKNCKENNQEINKQRDAKPSKPIPYHVYVKENKHLQTKTSENIDMKSQSVQNVDETTPAPTSEDVSKDLNEYVDISNGIMPKPALDESKTTDPTTRETIEKSKIIKETYEKPNIVEKTRTSDKNHNIFQPKWRRQKTITDLFADHFQQEQDPVDRSYNKEPRKTSENSRNNLESLSRKKLQNLNVSSGMHLAMEENVSNRRGLERKACWGDEEEEEETSFDILGTIDEDLEIKDKNITKFLSKSADETNDSGKPVINGLEQHKDRKTIQERFKTREHQNDRSKVSKDEYKAPEELKGNTKGHSNTSPKGLPNESMEQLNMVPEVELSGFLNRHSNTVPKDELTSKTSLNGRLQQPQKLLTTECRSKDRSMNEGVHLSETPSSHGSVVRNMINIYNKATQDSKQANDTTSLKCNQKNLNRKSWDGANHDLKTENISSPKSKKTIKSNSDSNLMNLPKDQKKDIQIKIRASQELFELRQQSNAHSKESSTTNSPRESVDYGNQKLSLNKSLTDSKVLQGMTSVETSKGSTKPRISTQNVKDKPYMAC